MKNHLLPVLVLTFVMSLNNNAFSQKEKRGIIGVSLGSATPLGEFASTDSNSDEAGFAKTGAFFGIDFNYLLSKSVGIAATLRGRSNTVDEDALITEFTNSSGVSGWVVNTEPWSAAGLLGGLYVAFPVGKKTEFCAKGLIGFMNCKSATISVSNSGVNAKTASATSSSFAYLISGGFQFNLTNSLALSLNLEYQGAQPEFKATTTSNFAPASVDTFDQPMSTLNFGIGLGFRL